MVGTKRSGKNFEDRDHEAVSGDLVSQIHTRLKIALGYRPNIVIINGGTNNANNGIGLGTMYQQMEDLVKEIWGAENMSDTCVILSTLLPTDHAQGALNRIGINQAYRSLVSDYRGSKCIYLADMEPQGEGKNFLGINEDIW